MRESTPEQTDIMWLRATIKWVKISQTTQQSSIYFHLNTMAQRNLSALVLNTPRASVPLCVLVCNILYERVVLIGFLVEKQYEKNQYLLLFPFF